MAFFNVHEDYQYNTTYTVTIIFGVCPVAFGLMKQKTRY